jgi:cell division protein FtsL
MGAASFVFLISAVLVTVAVCFAYLYVQSGITSMKNQVVSLQAEIAQTKQENQETYEKIMDSVDLSEVYAIATGELGMTQAVDNQVYKYNNSKSDMVKQYGDIPSSTK